MKIEQTGTITGRNMYEGPDRSDYYLNVNTGDNVFQITVSKEQFYSCSVNQKLTLTIMVHDI